MPLTTVPSTLLDPIPVSKVTALQGRNLLMNPGFNVNQRAYVSAAATVAANQYTVDRWRVVTSGQNLTFAAGVATAPAGGLEQVLEGINIPITGTYTLTWTGTATATVAGNAVTSGGNVTLTAGTNTTIRFTGGTVSFPQLEFGAVASAFELRPFPLELQLCQRYYEKSFAYATAPAQNVASTAGAATGNCLAASTSINLATVWFKVAKRTAATPVLYNPSAANAQIRNVTGATDFTASAVAAGEAGFGISGTSPAAATIGQLCAVHWTVDAEL